jgi:hypothetical protein
MASKSGAPEACLQGAISCLGTTGQSTVGLLCRVPEPAKQSPLPQLRFTPTPTLHGARTGYPIREGWAISHWGFPPTGKGKSPGNRTYIP